MSTIGGLSTSTSGSIRGYGGLASGLDRDSLIEGMTYGTTSKITQQKQKKTQLEWKQAAIRSISDLMISFAGKYTESLSSPTNLFSSLFWGRNKITPTGANSNKVAISGTASAADAITIMGVKQMAQKATWSSSKGISDKTLSTTTAIDKAAVEKKYEVQNLVDKTLSFKYNDKEYSITLGLTDSNGELYDYSTAEGIEKAINDQLAKVSVDDNTKLSNIISVSANGDLIAFSGKGAKLTGGSAADLLGFEKGKNDDGTDKDTEWDLSTPQVKTIKTTELTDEISFAEKVGGKGLTFSYNGTTKTIYMMSKEKLEEIGADDMSKEIKEDLQKKLDDAFGSGRITVGNDGDKLSFKTTLPNGKGDDTTSTLTLVSGNSDLVGPNGVLGVKAGESNRLNMNDKLSESVLKGKDFPQTIEVGGKKIKITEDDTMNSLIDKINKETDVSVSYQAVADKFVFTSKENGASGKISFGGDAKVLNALFGEGASTANETGTDAIVAVKYAGSDEVVELVRDTNSFTVDGLTITAKGTFGYKNTSNDPKKPNLVLDETSEPVEINAQVDVDKVMDSIKSMVEEYNKIVDLVNKELGTKPNRDYAPLTSEQKKELSDDDIKLWEEKAKEGLLFGDSDLRSLSSDLRFVITGGLAEQFREIGISTSTLYSDNGKISIDETKLRAALETNPEKVEQLFTSKAGTDAEGKPTFDGLATNLRNVMDKYVKTIGSMETKGILIKKAGSTSSPMSVTENTIYKQISEIEKMIAKLQDRLESERDRYIKQFTSLETLISQMNSQSGFLSQLGGY